jgi:hypothetical protein
MALNFVSSGGGSPFIRFSVENNEWVMSSAGGELMPVDFTSPVIIDVENTQQGWLKLDGGRDWIEWPNNQPTERPDDKYRQGFVLKFFSSKLFDDEPVRELSSNGAGMTVFLKSLYEQAEASGNFGSGKVPAVKILKATPVRIGKGPTKVPQFEIVKWVDRPDELGAGGDVAVSQPTAAAASTSSGDDSFDEEI